MMKPNFKTDFPLINAVIQKKQQGKVYEYDDFDFIAHKSGFSYLNLKTENINSIVDFFANEQSLKQYFHIYHAPFRVVEAIKKDNRFGYKYRKRIQFQFNEKTINSGLSKSIPSKFGFKTINENNFNSLDIFELDLPNRYWNSKNDFLQHGYGILAYDKEHDKPVSLCYSSCVSNDIAEIDVATLQAYRGLGLAKAVTERFIQHSIDKAIIPNWDCFEENTPSLKTAQSLGFEKIKEYWFLSVYNKTKSNE